MKKCKSCNEIKDLSYFYDHNKSKDKKFYRCIECISFDKKKPKSSTYTDRQIHIINYMIPGFISGDICREEIKFRFKMFFPELDTVFDSIFSKALEKFMLDYKHREKINFSGMIKYPKVDFKSKIKQLKINKGYTIGDAIKNKEILKDI